MENQKITVAATVQAGAQQVWEAWNRPEHITQWNFATDEWCCPSAYNDLRIGGKFRSRMEARDGSSGFDFEGVYDEIDTPRKIRYTMADGRQVTTTFEDQGPQTLITTTFDAETQHSEEMQKQGWQAILNNFKKYTETLTP